jgi:hypothetical protein
MMQRSSMGSAVQRRTTRSLMGGAKELDGRHGAKKDDGELYGRHRGAR